MRAINLIKYLIVVLETGATSFCYYENRQSQQQKSALIPYPKLKEAVDFAIMNCISINFIYGSQKLPTEYGDLIETVNHVKIVPLSGKGQLEGDIIVIDKDSRHLIPEIPPNFHLNIILRLVRDDLRELSKIFHSLLGKFRRLNLSLIGVGTFRDEDLNQYEKQLNIIETPVVEEYRASRMIEIGFISDRMMIPNMKNCDAGITHLTVAPNGKLYLCPGFYYDNPEHYFGDLKEGYEIKNSHLLRLSHAPICCNCDAYHCKRCIYLNKKTTSELNTPSRQQCVISHLERNNSMRILESLRSSSEAFQQFTPIPEIPYLDPFDIVNDNAKLDMDEEERERLVSRLLSKPLVKLSTEELLYQVYKFDKELLIRLKDLYRG
jgi:CXXX repeat peptide maturase